MKNLFLVAGLLSISAAGFAQQQNVSKNVQASDTVVTVEKAPAERMIKLEDELANVKATPIKMQKHFAGIRPIVPATTEKKKLVVNRVGSKQLIWVKEQ